MTFARDSSMHRPRLRLEGHDCRCELGFGALARLPYAIGGNQAACLLDASVQRAHGRFLAEIWRKMDGQPAARLVRPGGERVKRLAELEAVYGWLARAGLPRDGVLVGIGGGALLDLAGLAAATWLRGVRFVAVPTTLLAMVDAALGGKTAINVVGVKNNVGAFHPASHIIADPIFLLSLPVREWRCGLAEMIKAAVIGDPTLFVALERRAGDLAGLFARGQARRPPAGDVQALPWSTWIARAVRVKARIVRRDFRERGLRRTLNLGHTLGHALEAANALSHGEAVSIGMAVVATVAARRGLCHSADAARIVRLLAACGLPVTAPLPSRRRLTRLIAADKKRLGERVGWVLPAAIGKVVLDQAVDLDEIAAALRQLGASPLLR